MPLVQCPECQREVSSEALSCPQCAFPYPGKKERLNGKASESLLTCQDCGNFISKQAQSCPHCGAPSLKQEDVPDSVLESSDQVEQTWLCPNCGVPYTRRGKGGRTNSPVSEVSQNKSLPMASARGGPPQVEAMNLDGRLPVNALSPRRERRPSPLWEETKAFYEDEPQFPRPQKKWGLFFLIFFTLLFISLASFAIWQVKGLNPLEALVYWQM